jgi:hypothetical protein
MPLSKTDKARAELALSRGELNRRQRTLLLLADGRKSADELVSMVGGAEAADVELLLQQGYLSDPTLVARTAAAIDRAPPALSMRTDSSSDEERRLRLNAAATKMFLLDMTERSFAQRDPALRQTLRMLLGAARDEQGLMAAADQLLIHLAVHAGEDRAAGVRQQLFIELEPA